MTSRLNCDNKVVGIKQVKRAIDKDETQTVFIAEDADENITKDVSKLCKDKQIQIVHVDNMDELGKACGIDINAAVAALLK
jgi:large subunit ribosomal protein L7A